MPSFSPPSSMSIPIDIHLSLILSENRNRYFNFPTRLTLLQDKGDYFSVGFDNSASTQSFWCDTCIALHCDIIEQLN